MTRPYRKQNDEKYFLALAAADLHGVKVPKTRETLYRRLFKVEVEWIDGKWIYTGRERVPAKRAIGVRIVGDAKMAEHFDAIADLITDYLSEHDGRIAKQYDSPTAARTRYLALDFEVTT